MNGVHPKVLQTVTLSLFTTELYLAIANLAFAHIVYQSFESDLRSLYVQKYSILRYIALKELD